MNREKLLDLLSKLKRMAEQTSSPEEAAIAAARMQDLCVRYKVSLSEVDVDGNEDELIVLDVAEDEGAKELVRWRADLLDAIARSGFCKVIYGASRRRADRVACRRIPRRASLEIFGRDSDVQTVLYRYKYLVSEINRLGKEGVEGALRLAATEYVEEKERAERMLADGMPAYYVEDRLRQCRPPTARAWLGSFRRGAVDVIATRLYLARKQTEKQLDAEQAVLGRGSCTALVKRSEQEVEEFVAEKYPRLGTVSRAARPSSNSGYHAGRAAGENINLGGGGGPGLRAPAKQLNGGR